MSNVNYMSNVNSVNKHMNNLKKDSNGNYTCCHCHKYVFPEIYDKYHKNQVMKYGLCLHCIAILNAAKEIDENIHSNEYNHSDEYNHNDE